MYSSKQNSPSNVSVNSQKLASMIDSLNSNRKQVEPIIPDDSTLEQPPSMLYMINEARDNKTSPNKESSVKFPNKRFSINSDYSGIVDEGVEVSYVVNNSNNAENLSMNVFLQPSLPTLPSTTTSRAQVMTQNNSMESKEEVIIQSVPNVKSVSRFNSQSTISLKDPQSKQGSLKLLSIARHRKDIPSIASGNIASESGSSNYNPNIKGDHQEFHSSDFNEMQPQECCLSEENLRTLDSNNSSDIVKNVTPSALSIPVKSTPPIGSNDKVSEPRNTKPVLSNLIVPPKSKNRSLSKIMIQQGLDDIEFRLKEELAELDIENNNSETVLNSKAPVKDTSSRTDIFYSTSNFQKNNTPDDISRSQIHEDDNTYLVRPLPATPNSEVNYENDGETFSNAGMNTENSSLHTVKIVNPGDLTITAENDSEDEDNYQDIIEEIPLSTEQPTSIQKAKKQNSEVKKEEKKIKDKNKLKSFNVESLAELLKLTENSMMGSEFSNQGMQDEERRSIQRLIDALSRLTTDIVIDPELYEEGIERLKGATRALEGF